VRRDLSNSCGKSHANSRDMASSAPLWYATELQAVQRVVELHSEDLKRVESTLRGLQWRMTQNTDSLAQRVEALERPSKVMEPARRCHRDTHFRHVDVLATSFADLESRFQLFSSDTVEMFGNCTTAVAELREQTRDGPSILTTNNLQACIQNASSLILRLETLCEEVQGHSGSADQLQEMVRDTVTLRLKELLPEVNDGHGLRNPRSGEESPPFCVHPQPIYTAFPVATMLLRPDSSGSIRQEL